MNTSGHLIEQLFLYSASPSWLLYLSQTKFFFLVMFFRHALMTVYSVSTVHCTAYSILDKCVTKYSTLNYNKIGVQCFCQLPTKAKQVKKSLGCIAMVLNRLCILIV